MISINIVLLKKITYEYLKNTKSKIATVFAIHTIYQRYVNATTDASSNTIIVSVNDIKNALVIHGLIDTTCTVFVI